MYYPPNDKRNGWLNGYSIYWNVEISSDIQYPRPAMSGREFLTWLYLKADSGALNWSFDGRDSHYVLHQLYFNETNKTVQFSSNWISKAIYANQHHIDAQHDLKYPHMAHQSQQCVNKRKSNEDLRRTATKQRPSPPRLPPLSLAAVNMVKHVACILRPDIKNPIDFIPELSFWQGQYSQWKQTAYKLAKMIGISNLMWQRMLELTNSDEECDFSWWKLIALMSVWEDEVPNEHLKIFLQPPVQRLLQTCLNNNALHSAPEERGTQPEESQINASQPEERDTQPEESQINASQPEERKQDIIWISQTSANEGKFGAYKKKLDEAVMVGGFGTVYAEESGKYVIKENNMDTGANYWQDSLNELRVLKALEHRNVVKLKQAYASWNEKTNRKSLYIIMENAGVTLYHLIYVVKANKGFLEPAAKEITKQLSSAMNYLYEQDIIHRDIKPSNVMYKKGVVKLIDFGLACMDNSSRTDMTGNVGTFKYMAPELITKKYSVKIKDDDHGHKGLLCV